MRKHITGINIFIVILVIYAIVLTFIAINRQTQISDILMQYNQSKIELLENTNRYEKQIHNYEIYMLKNNDVVDNANNHELDSLWAAWNR